MTIYLDNASTSFPKPKEVIQSISEYLSEYGVSPNRGTYSLAEKAEKLVLKTRMLLCKLINAKNPNNLIFTLNATHGLNLIIKGFLKPRDHVLICSYNHNSVIRPLERLKKKKGVFYDIFTVNTDGKIDLKHFKKSIRKNTKLVIFNHASNVIGVISSFSEIISICRDYNIYTLLDCSQSLGYIPVDSENVDFLVGTGHKSLLGPSGVGFAYIKNYEHIDTFMEGGSGGNHSLSPFHPAVGPYKFEAGTLNTSCIAGLFGSLNYIMKLGFDKIFNKSMDLIKYAWKQLEKIDEIILYGTNDMKKKIPVISFNIKNVLPSECAYIYNQENICIRSGIHCAPLIHKSLKTLPTGTIRISPGHYNTLEEIDQFIEVTKKIIKETKLYA